MRARAKERQLAGNALGGKGGKSLASLPTTSNNVIPLRTDAELAKATGVSPRTAQDALTVKERGRPEDWQDVVSGRASISGKANEVRTPRQDRLRAPPAAIRSQRPFGSSQ
jgi:hypothetical protein